MNKTLNCWCGVTSRLRNAAVLVALVAALNVLFCAQIVGSLVPSASAATEDAALASRLDAVLDAALAQQKIVGAVVVAARNGQVVYQRAQEGGPADRATGAPDDGCST